VGSDADTCPMALCRPWAVEIKKGLAAMAYSKAHVFLGHAHALPRSLQDMRADDIIMTCKLYGHALQCSGYEMIGWDYATDRSPHDKTGKTNHAHATKDIMLLLAISALLHRVLSVPGPPVGPRVSFMDSKTGAVPVFKTDR
jgi:hypothetical protein